MFPILPDSTRLLTSVYRTDCKRMLSNTSTSKAMAMMIAAMLMLPGIDAIAKWLAGSISSGQVTWSRFFFQIILMSPLLLHTRGPWLTPSLLLHAARGSLIAFATLFFFSGLAYLPLADAIAIFFIEPLLVTLLSALFFGEAIHWRRISAIGLGFIGGADQVSGDALGYFEQGSDPAAVAEVDRFHGGGAGEAAGVDLAGLEHGGRVVVVRLILTADHEQQRAAAEVSPVNKEDAPRQEDAPKPEPG